MVDFFVKIDPSDRVKIHIAALQMHTLDARKDISPVIPHHPNEFRFRVKFL
jgi:hypothetical protein